MPTLTLSSTSSLPADTATPAALGATLLLVPVLLAAAKVHLPNGWVFTAPGGGWEYPVFLAVASVVQWLIGDGAFALRRSAWLVPGAAR